ncbi:hypothetical protein AXK60_21890 [Tsukamurella pseudospumae]|uniref:Uncharacterized protein n=1 Tax=Tsukamurella pseudospumae TaxID=239498 RepID=A0A138AUL5_9ACTN|nr:hypothetical protein AXK60_21890 [Tsukamurella pseudospumae]
MNIGFALEQVAVTEAGFGFGAGAGAAVAGPMANVAAAASATATPAVRVEIVEVFIGASFRSRECSDKSTRRG